MADTPAEPDWSLLPNHPAGFFGLGAQFDRRELKRAYNELIRRFKPERFPQEFQRIRAAYEELEDAIRYGAQPESPTVLREPTEWPEKAAAWHQLTLTDGQPTTQQSLEERIRSGDVQCAYEELKAQRKKSPLDFYTLALLSDVVPGSDAHQFADWLLRGLQVHPNEAGLSRLLHTYLSELPNLDGCEPLLVECSKVLGEMVFYPVTDPFWQRLLRAGDFERFARALKLCEANFKGLNIDNRIAFYIYILKPAVWLADKEWLAQAYGFIDSNYDRVPNYLDYDLEILSRLKGYQDVRDSFVAISDLTARLDAAIQSYFTDEQTVADQHVLDCQSLIARDTNQLSAAFADYENPIYEVFFSIWLWVSFDVSQRHVEPPKDAHDEGVWFPRTETLICRLTGQIVMS